MGIFNIKCERYMNIFICIHSRYFFHTVFIISLSTIFSGCFGSGNEDIIDEQIYATVNGVHLTESGLRAIVPKDFYDRLTIDHKRQIIEEWVNNELLYQEAQRIKIDNDPEIKRLLLNSKRNLLSNEVLERELSKINIPDENELKIFYEDNKEYFKLQANEYRIRYALFDNKKDATDFYRRVKSNQSFSELAKEYSKHPSSHDGGNLGVVNEESVEPPIWENILSTVTKYGMRKISDPFIVIDGWGCVIVDEEFKGGSIKPFEYVRDLVLAMYMAEKHEKTRDELIKKLRVKADIRYEFP